MYKSSMSVEIADVVHTCRYVISNYTLRFVACGQLDDKQFGFFCLIMMNVAKVHKKFLINVFIGGTILAD